MTFMFSCLIEKLNDLINLSIKYKTNVCFRKKYFMKHFYLVKFSVLFSLRIAKKINEAEFIQRLKTTAWQFFYYFSSTEKRETKSYGFFFYLFAFY